MKINALVSTLIAASAIFLAGVPASAQSPLGANAYPVPVSDGRFSPSDLDQMLKPIALYPDRLLAEILPAATYPAQIQAAAQYLTIDPQGLGVQTQPWAPEVKALERYPQIVNMMNQDLNWTAALGQAYATQGGDVNDSIQRLRREAYDSGYLQSNSQEVVSFNADYLSIAAVNYQYCYVPSYDPAIVFVSRGNWHNRPDGFRQPPQRLNLTFNATRTVNNPPTAWNRSSNFTHPVQPMAQQPNFIRATGPTNFVRPTNQPARTAQVAQGSVAHSSNQGPRHERK